MRLDEYFEGNGKDFWEVDPTEEPEHLGSYLSMPDCEGQFELSRDIEHDLHVTTKPEDD